MKDFFKGIGILVGLTLLVAIMLVGMFVQVTGFRWGPGSL